MLDNLIGNVMYEEEPSNDMREMEWLSNLLKSGVGSP